jgi:hypothetical protein
MGYKSTQIKIKKKKMKERKIKASDPTLKIKMAVISKGIKKLYNCKSQHIFTLTKHKHGTQLLP